MALRGLKMSQAAQPESESHRLVRKLVTLKMTVSKVFIGFDGKKFLAVNGFALRVDELLEMETAGELTPRGITEYIGKLKTRPSY
jgi:hypothetical protein